MSFSLIGAPGVGKGTFSKLLRSRLKLHHISLGDIVRSEIKRQSLVGQKAQHYVQQGQLIPDTIVNEIVLRELEKHSFSSVLLDGFPRNLPQAEYLDKCMPDLTAVHIELDMQVAIDKLLGRRLCSLCGGSFNVTDICRDGFDMPAILPYPELCPPDAGDCINQNMVMRSDDTRDTIKKRFEVFEKETSPVLNYFMKKNKLKTFHVKKGIKDIDSLIELMMAP